MITDNGFREAQITRVIDGDTIEARVLLDEYEQIAMKWRVRLSIIDAPERGTDGADAATEYVKGFLGQIAQIKTIADGGFGRRLCEVYVGHGDDQENLSELLLRLGLATYYGK